MFCLLFSGFCDPAQMVGPEALEVSAPVMHGFELLRVQPIQPPLTRLVNGNQAHLPQHTQMPGYRRLRQTELDHQFSHIALRTLGKQLHNLPPTRFSDGVENIGGCRCPSHGAIIFPYGNISSKKPLHLHFDLLLVLCVSAVNLSPKKRSEAGTFKVPPPSKTAAICKP